ncbi:MAG: glycosyltransferase family 39 protein [Burkholderiales bacterium]|nr:glycosyltransferase family 39 protein [Anaerolineae bacterium]
MAWLLVAVVIVAGGGWAAWLLAQSRLKGGGWLLATLTLALSVGAISLLMLWEGLIGIPFSLWGVTLPYLALALPGWWLWWRARGAWGLNPKLEVVSGSPLKGLAPTPPPNIEMAARETGWIFRWFIVALLVIISAGVLFNAAYWPFYRDDTLGIYAPQAAAMYGTRALIPIDRIDVLYETYPMLMPLTYTYTYLASGWANEYLAKLVSALLALACLPTAYELGKALYGRMSGALAALLLALTPTFGRWASSGYVDLPMAFFYTLAALFAWRLWQARHWSDALLAGILVGLAAWTKNAGLIGIAVLTLWLLWALINRRISWREMVLALAACAVVAGPWYARNLLLGGVLIPDTAWVDQAQRSSQNLMVFITRDELFGLAGWVILAAVIGALVRLVRLRGDAPEHALLLLWTLPFFAAWWLYVSYDPRFLLLFLPALIVLGGAWLAYMWGSVPSRWRTVAAVLAAAVVLAMALLVVWNSVEFKDAILRNPLMDDAAKRTLIFGEE